MPTPLDMHGDDECLKGLHKRSRLDCELDELFEGIDSKHGGTDNSGDLLDDEISKALQSMDYDSKLLHASLSSPEDLSPFDSPPNTVSSTSDVSHVDSDCKLQQKDAHAPQHTINLDTVRDIKRSMVETSRVISTFITLKSTYLKLCKEFNYLLAKFNDNEKIKIELIHENNELKKLLTQIITERELEKKMLAKQLPHLA